MPIGTVEQAEITILEHKSNQKKSFLYTKRAFDFCVSLLALIVLAIPMLIVALCIYIESPGPVIYKQERLGKGGKPFMMYKFRSMRLDAEKDGPQWADINDDRCTKMGRFIRQWHIDELPQLWNVLKGDMSVVGPRPERECFYEDFEKETPGFRTRLVVDQGMTGYAQVNGGYDATPSQKLELDVAYINAQSAWMDIKCLFKTVLVVFKRKGVR